MAIIEKDAVMTVKDQNGNTYVLKPFTSVENVDGAVASINGQKPDSQGNVALDTGKIPLKIF